MKFPEDKPFGEWSEDEKVEFFKATILRKEAWGSRASCEHKWVEAAGWYMPGFDPDAFYRLTPKPKEPFWLGRVQEGVGWYEIKESEIEHWGQVIKVMEVD